MASFALLPIYSGFTYDLPNQHIGFAPVKTGDFRSFWAVGTGWGDYLRTQSACRIVVRSGSILLSSVRLADSQVQKLLVDGKERPFRQEGDLISFAPVPVKKEMRFLLS